MSSRFGGAAFIAGASFRCRRQFRRGDQSRIVKMLGQHGKAVLMRECPQIGQYVENPFMLHAELP
jgi:hypothetical protein